MSEFIIDGISDQPDEDGFEIITCHPTDVTTTVSSLISTLQQIIAEHGDLPIIQEGDDGSAASIIGYCLVMHQGETKVMM